MKKLFIVQTNKMEKKGDSFYIDLNIDIPKLRLQDSESIMLVPVLTEGDHHKELPLILINGRTRHRGYLHMVWELGDTVMRTSYEIYKAFRSRSFCNSICYYKIKIAYESWMSNAHIDLQGVDDVPSGELYVSMS
ncbi:MAG: DUF3868 domain-containing protein [Dysgonomonas sp.]|nr:DUF3868 domain-containing protein [Dysgonomonas sp.]